MKTKLNIIMMCSLFVAAQSVQLCCMNFAQPIPPIRPSTNNVYTNTIGIAALSIAAGYITYICTNNKKFAYIAAATGLCSLRATALYKVLLNRKLAKQQARLEAGWQALLEDEFLRRRQQKAEQVEAQQQRLSVTARTKAILAPMRHYLDELGQLKVLINANPFNVDLRKRLETLRNTREYDIATIVEEKVIEAMHEFIKNQPEECQKLLEIAEIIAQNLHTEPTQAIPQENVQAAYQVLGSNVHDTDKAIRKKYHKLSVAFHPDKHPENPKARQKFIVLKEAFDVLIKHRQSLRK